MSIIQLIVTLVVVGVIMWLVNAYIPMQNTIKQILNVVIVIVAILFVLSAFGILRSFSGLRIGR